MCTVITATAFASGSMSAVGGSSPAWISVWRCFATNTARSSASSDDWERMMSKKRAMFESASSFATESVSARRLSQPELRRNA